MGDPRRESPLHATLRGARADGGPAAAELGSVTLAERPHRGHHALRGRAADVAAVLEEVLGVRLPETPNTLREAGRLTVAWLAPSEWLILLDRPGDDAGGDPADGAGDEPRSEGDAGGRIPTLAARLPPERSGLVDLSSGQTLVALRGAGAPELVCAGCPLDLHPRVFPPGSCAQSHLAKAPVLVLHREPPGPDSAPRFELVLRRSYAPHVWRWLIASAASLSGHPRFGRPAAASPAGGR